MRVVRRAEFLSLPAGILYRQGHRWAFDDMMVKGDTLRPMTERDAGDWTFLSLDLVAAENGEDLFATMEAMFESGASRPLDVDAWSRDGQFDEASIFVVYEMADLIALRSLLDGLITQHARCEAPDARDTSRSPG